MFKTTRNRLMFFFSGLIFVFLIVFNGISYFVLSTIIYSESEKNILLLAGLEETEHAADLQRHKPDAENGKNVKNEHDSEEEEHDNNKIPAAERTILQPFYYVLNASGSLVAEQQSNRASSAEVVRFLKNWIPASGEVKYATFLSRSGEKVHLLFAGRPIYVDGLYQGAIYTGADISQQAEIFRKLFLVLIVLSAIFFVVSVFLGYVMSSKAMGPIFRSFKRQQQFVADASHELRTPISVIQSSLEVIEVEERETMQPFSRQVLDDLQDEVRRMSSLLQDLLTLARVDADQMQLQFDDFSIQDEIEKMIRKLQPLADEKQQSLTLESTQDVMIRADRGRLQQLMMILLDNAIQYTPVKGSIVISVQFHGHSMALSIADTGAGIAKERQQDIFERFYRNDSARAHGRGNVGLGLSIAKWIVEAHNGTIQVKSEPDQGSTFTATLPVRL
ncbi:MAG: ATP-binding protein [Paenibacillaceae bacterium]